MAATVGIACVHEHLPRSESASVIVAVDVIRATTTAITAALAGRRVFVVSTIEAAVPLAARLDDPLLAGELGGFMPYGFHMQNSPAAAADGAGERPMILLSTSGTRLMAEAGERGEAYAACLRNTSAQVEVLAGRGDDVLLLGADSRGEFREEDKLCCARIARGLVERGYSPADALTQELLAVWGDAADEAFLGSRSVRYLRDTGQEHDLRYVLDHVDDVRAVFPILAGEIRVRRLP